MKSGSTESKYIVDITGNLPVILIDLNLTDSSLKKKYIYVADPLGGAEPMGADRQILAQHACPWGNIDAGELKVPGTFLGERSVIMCI